MNTSTDRIERKIVLKATRARVWRALTNIDEFNSWFGVRLSGKQFAAGERFTGNVTYPGYEHLTMEVTIQQCEPEKHAVVAVASPRGRRRRRTIRASRLHWWSSAWRTPSAAPC